MPCRQQTSLTVDYLLAAAFFAPSALTLFLLHFPHTTLHNKKHNITSHHVTSGIGPRPPACSTLLLPLRLARGRKGYPPVRGDGSARRLPR